MQELRPKSIGAPVLLNAPVARQQVIKSSNPQGKSVSPEITLVTRKELNRVFPVSWLLATELSNSR
jgi:hypothetical protein